MSNQCPTCVQSKVATTGGVVSYVEPYQFLYVTQNVRRFKFQITYVTVRRDSAAGEATRAVTYVTVSRTHLRSGTQNPQQYSINRQKYYFLPNSKLFSHFVTQLSSRVQYRRTCMFGGIANLTLQYSTLERMPCK